MNEAGVQLPVPPDHIVQQGEDEILNYKIRFLTTNDIAKVAGISRRKVQNYVETGLTESVPSNSNRLGRRFSFYDMVAVMLFTRLEFYGFSTKKLGRISKQIYSVLRVALNLKMGDDRIFFVEISLDKNNAPQVRTVRDLEELSITQGAIDVFLVDIIKLHKHAKELTGREMVTILVPKSTV